MKSKNIIFQLILIACTLISFSIKAQQKNILINGEAVTFDCAKIMSVDGLVDTITAQKVTIYNAEILNNCLEISIIYGGCNANVELVTDNKVIETQVIKMNFLLKYIEPSNCKGLIKTKLTFDLAPYKNIRAGRYLIIALLGTNYNLNYTGF